MPPSYPLGDVTSLLSVKVRPRLNKGLNHCLSVTYLLRWGGLHTAAEGLYDILLKPALAHTLQTARALPPLLHLLVRRRLQRFVG